MRTQFLIPITFFVAALSSNAYALKISGWGFSINSPLRATINLQGVPNPSSKPTIVVVDATLDEIEYFCVNPNNYNVAPGEAGSLTVMGTERVEDTDVTTNGQATVNLIFNIDGPYECVNPNWTYVDNTAAVKLVTVNLAYYECAGDPKVDDDPCYLDGEPWYEVNKKAGSASGVCTLDPVERDPYTLIPVPGQIYECVEN